MKNVKLALLFITNIFLFSCEKDSVTSSPEIPSAINSYLATHFSNSTVQKFSKDHDSYEVDLSGNTSIDFNLNFEPTSIESRSKLPDSVIPQSILDYVKALFPNNYIVEWEKEINGQKIELNDGREISFNSEGQSFTLPTEIISYLKTHFPNAIVVEFEKDVNDYEVDLAGDTSIKFNSKFEPITIESKNKLPDSVIPQNILDHVKTNFPNNFIVEWEKEVNGQKIELNNGKEINFNSQGQSLTLPTEITTYLNTHFPNAVVVNYEKDVNDYEVDLAGDTSIKFNLKFEPISIESKSKLPDSVIPQSILDHVKTNFPNNFIVEWEKEVNTQKIELNNGKEISFPL